MNEQHRRFDWWAFFVRLMVIGVLATWLLIERLGKGDHVGAILVIVIGYAALPAAAYLHTRYQNSRFIGPVVEAVRRRVLDEGKLGNT